MLQTLLFILTVVKTTNCRLLQPDEGFSITVIENVTGEAGLCIRVFCSFTVPQGFSDPINRTWLKGNSTVEDPFFNSNVKHNEMDCSFMVRFLIPGESDGEYRLKLESGQGNVYIFPQTVNLTVKELKKKPTIKVPRLTEGQKAEISCEFNMDCTSPKNPLKIVWTGVESKKVQLSSLGVPGRIKTTSTMFFYPEPEHHNINLTCAVIFPKSLRTEATVTLKIKLRSAPRILNQSSCWVWADELTCMCVSSGFPLPNINWPILDGAAEYYTVFSSENTISISKISIPSLTNVSDTFECVSKNVIGMTKKKMKVLNLGKNPEELSWSSSTPWILFTLSVLVNIIIASCLIDVLRRTKCKTRDDAIYMTSLKREESVYETIKI